MSRKIQIFHQLDEKIEETFLAHFHQDRLYTTFLAVSLQSRHGTHRAASKTPSEYILIRPVPSVTINVANCKLTKLLDSRLEESDHMQ